MRKLASIALLMTVLLSGDLITAPIQAADQTDGYPIGWPALDRLDLLPLLPPNGTQTRQFISYDTGGGNRGAFDHFKRYEEDGEWVFFDEMGPGALYRLQMNVWQGGGHMFNDDTARIRFRFDGEKEPRIDMSFAEFFGVKKKAPEPFTPPLSFGSGGFAILYYPFTFAKRLRISAYHPKLEGWGGKWYQFTHLKYPPGTAVQTWPGPSSDSAVVRQQWSRLGEDPKPATEAAVAEKSAALKAGESLHLNLDRPGVIQSLNITMKPWTTETFHKVRLRIIWDDHEKAMVDLPVGCFFGGGGDGVFEEDIAAAEREGKAQTAKGPIRATIALQTLKTLMFGYDGTQGRGYSYWPMPFWKKARLELINDSGRDLEQATLQVAVDAAAIARYPQPHSGYLAVTRTQEYVLPGVDAALPALVQRGYGKLVGMTMYSKNYYMDCDEFTYLDGSKTPQIHGDGTEDDHNQGWGGAAHQKPLWGGLIDGFQGAYRLYLADPYIFNSEIRKTYEVERDPRTDFVCWTYLGTPGICNLSLSDTLDVGNADSETKHGFQIQGETWAGETKAAYDTYMHGNPFPCQDNGRAFDKSCQFTVAIDPANEGVRLRRRLNRNLANIQLAKVVVDGQELADAPWYFCDLPTLAQTAFADHDFEIPVRYTRGKSQITVRLEHVRAQPAAANNLYRIEAYSYGRKPLPPPVAEPAPRPRDLVVQATPDRKIRLTWKSVRETPGSYVIERQADDEANFTPLVTLNGGTTSYVDKTVRDFRAYYYRVRAESPDREPSIWMNMARPVLLMPPGNNQLTGATATATSAYHDKDEWNAAKVCDGNLSTRWSSKGKAHDEHPVLTLTLPEAKRLSSLVFHQCTDYARIPAYTVQAQVDGAWKDIAKGGLMPDIAVVTFEPITTKALRFEFQAYLNPKIPITLFEIGGYDMSYDGKK